MLIYGNCSSYSMMFCQVLVDLKDCYLQCLQVIYLFSQELMDSDLLQGCIDGDKLCQFVDYLLDFSCFDEVFICGLVVMMDEVEVMLCEFGVVEKLIYFECFNISGGNVKWVVGVQVEGCMVIICQDGCDWFIVFSVEDDSILDVVLCQGVDLLFVCKGGVCVICKCKVLCGEVVMVVNYSLEVDELVVGYVLSCQLLLISGDVVVDFDVWGMV